MIWSLLGIDVGWFGFTHWQNQQQRMGQGSKCAVREHKTRFLVFLWQHFAATSLESTWSCGVQSSRDLGPWSPGLGKDLYVLYRWMKHGMGEYKIQQSMRTNLAVLRQRTCGCFLLTLSLMTARKIKTVMAINRATEEGGQILHHSWTRASDVLPEHNLNICLHQSGAWSKTAGFPQGFHSKEKQKKKCTLPLLLDALYKWKLV